MRYSQFLSSSTRVGTTIYDQFHQIFFNQLLVLMSLYQHAKDQACHHFSLEIFDLKILQSDQEHFGSYLRNQNFTKHEICSRIQQLV